MEFRIFNFMNFVPYWDLKVIHTLDGDNSLDILFHARMWYRWPHYHPEKGVIWSFMTNVGYGYIKVLGFEGSMKIIIHFRCRRSNVEVQSSDGQAVKSVKLGNESIKEVTRFLPWRHDYIRAASVARIRISGYILSYYCLDSLPAGFHCAPPCMRDVCKMSCSIIEQPMSWRRRMSQELIWKNAWDVQGHEGLEIITTMERPSHRILHKIYCK